LFCLKARRGEELSKRSKLNGVEWSVWTENWRTPTACGEEEDVAITTSSINISSNRRSRSRSVMLERTVQFVGRGQSEGSEG